MIFSLGYVMIFLIFSGRQDQRQYEIISIKDVNHYKRTFHPHNTSYTFRAFKKTFVLQVEPCAQFLSSSFHILTYTNYATNSSLEARSGDHLKKCIYRGRVKNDASSIVSLNLCKGLVSKYFSS